VLTASLQRVCNIPPPLGHVKGLLGIDNHGIGKKRARRDSSLGFISKGQESQSSLKVRNCQGRNRESLLLSSKVVKQVTK
jgi:hypothetical protein